MTIYSLYLITNLSNNKTYVGWTSRDPHLRFIEHQKTRKPKYQSRSAISYAIEKYGNDNFLFEVLTETTDQQYSKSLESFYVAWYGSLIDVWGYNKDFGGTGHKRTAETIEKHRQKLLGTKQSEEHKRKRAKKGKDNPMYGRTGDKHHNFGKILTDGERDLISKRVKESYKDREHPKGTQGKSFWNNGIECKMFKNDEVPPDGWVKGMLKRK